MPHERDESDVESRIRALNQAWKEGRFDELAGFFHSQVVFLPPGGEAMVGRETMVESYRQFAAMATVHGFEILDLEARVLGTAALASITFEVDYEIESGRYQEQGRETYLLESTADGWQVVWRTQVSEPTDA